MKSIAVRFVDRGLEEYESLNRIVGEEIRKGIKNSFNQQLLKSINAKKELLKCNAEYGDRVPRSLIPKELKVDNLWVIDLTGYWRMLYTVSGNKISVVCFILMTLDHPSYNKLFGYRDK